MDIKILDSMTDSRLGSQSILISIAIPDYLELVAAPYSRQGGVEGQRGALATTTALRIRERMEEDIRRGALLPPLVLGISAGVESVRNSAGWDDEALCQFIEKTERANIAIIDGMQRTTALKINVDALKNGRIRVELWIVPQSSALTYRMLVLNTGQVPWNLRRQLEVLNLVLLSEIRQAVECRRERDGTVPAIEIFGIDEKRRRSKAGQYQAHEIIELYLAFGMRKQGVDKESALADQFSRLDMVAAVASDDFFNDFVEVLIAMSMVDEAFEKVESGPAGGRFKNGRAIFDSQPACVAWAVAAAQLAYGRPGTERARSLIEAAILRIVSRARDLRSHLNLLSQEEIARFADLTTLNEVTGQATGQQAGKIGDFDRGFFLEAFRVLLSEQEMVTSMTPCWRAH